MSRQAIHSSFLFVTTLTLAAATLPLASPPPVVISAPAFAAPQQRATPTSLDATAACAPLQAGDAQSPPARSNVAATHAIPPHLQLPGLRGFGQVTPTLYRGGRPTEEGFQCLAKMGVSIVISQEGGLKDLHKTANRLGMQYVSMFWECSFPRDQVVARFLQLLRDNPGKKVFVYCHFGDDRTGMMIAAYRMAEQGWSAEQALEEMKAFGFNFFHRRICTGLSSYEEHFPSHWSDSPAFGSLRSSPPH